MRAVVIVVTGVLIAAWTIIGATSLANVSTEVVAVEPATAASEAASDVPAALKPTPTPSPTPTPTPTATSLPVAPVGSFVLGDSISLSIAPELSRLGYPIVGKVGQSASVPYLIEHLSSPAAQQAPAWVIVLGTNNAGDEEDVEEVREWVRTIRELRTKGAKQDVFWVTPHRPETYRGGMSAWTLQDLNARLHELAAERDWLTVLDFATTAEQRLEWFEQDGQHLHPDERGQAHLVELIAGIDPVLVDDPAPITTIAPPSPRPSPPAEANDDMQDYSDVEFSNE